MTSAGSRKSSIAPIESSVCRVATGKYRHLGSRRSLLREYPRCYSRSRGLFQPVPFWSSSLRDTIVISVHIGETQLCREVRRILEPSNYNLMIVNRDGHTFVFSIKNYRMSYTLQAYDRNLFTQFTTPEQSADLVSRGRWCETGHRWHDLSRRFGHFDHQSDHQLSVVEFSIPGVTESVFQSIPDSRLDDTVSNLLLIGTFVKK